MIVKLRFAGVVAACMAALFLASFVGCPLSPPSPSWGLLWAKQAGGDGSDRAYDLSASTDGWCMITGYFSGTATFGAGETGARTLSSAGAKDIAVAMYNPDGTLAWAAKAGGAGEDWGWGVLALSNGACFVAGSFEGTATFGAGETYQTQLVSAGAKDIFLAKYNPGGTLAWAVRAGGTGSDEALDVNLCPCSGLPIVTGYFSGEATFGPGETNQRTLVSQGNTDIFVARYQPANGLLSWAVSAGGTGEDRGLSIATPSGGDAIVTGFFSGNACFSQQTDAGLWIPSNGGKDVFLARFNSSGGLRWVTWAGGAGDDEGRGVAALSDGTPYVTGSFQGAAQFGFDPAKAFVTLTSAGDKDIFVAKYTSNGYLTWAKRAGGTLPDEGNAINPYPDGTCVVTGSFQGAATFGPGESKQTVVNAAGQDDVFVAKYGANGDLARVQRAGGTFLDSGLAVAALSDNCCLAAGRFRGTATFGTGTAAVTLTAPGGGPCDLFVAKYRH